MGWADNGLFIIIRNLQREDESAATCAAIRCDTATGACRAARTRSSCVVCTHRHPLAPPFGGPVPSPGSSVCVSQPPSPSCLPGGAERLRTASYNYNSLNEQPLTVQELYIPKSKTHLRIRYNQIQRATSPVSTISSHLQPSPAISSHLKPSQAISSHLQRGLPDCCW